MALDVGLRIWFFVAMLLLGLAYVLTGRVSELPRRWTNTGIALICLVGVVGWRGVGAVPAMMVGGVLALTALLGSAGLLLGMRRRVPEPGKRVLVAGGSLYILLGALRVLADAGQAATSTEAAALGELLTDGVMHPLLISLGAIAVFLGGRVASFPRGLYGLLSGVAFLVGTLLLVVAVGDVLTAGRLSQRAFVLACVAGALAAPTLMFSFRAKR